MQHTGHCWEWHPSSSNSSRVQQQQQVEAPMQEPQTAMLKIKLTMQITQQVQ
jgi:hypothetical protein